MKLIQFTLILLGFSIASIAPVESSIASKVPLSTQLQFDHFDQQTVYFQPADNTKPSVSMKTGLFDLTFIGELDESGRSPDQYFLFSAKPCANCAEDRMVYALAPNSGKTQAFVFPGKILDDSSRRLSFQSRGFYGRCLAGSESVLVFFQEEHSDRHRRLLPSVLIARPKESYLNEELLEGRRLPGIRTTLRRVKKGECHEITGRNRVNAQKLINVRVRSKTSPDS